MTVANAETNTHGKPLTQAHDTHGKPSAQAHEAARKDAPLAARKGGKAVPSEQETERTAFETGEKVGYAAIVAWLPTLLLNGALSDGDLAAACARLPEPLAALQSVLPAAFCLLLCGVFGLAGVLFANRITSRRNFFMLWTAAIACTAASLCIPSDVAGAALLAAAFTVARLLWKIHLVNKAFDPSTLIVATFLCGGVLLLSALLDEAAAGFSLCLLLIVALCMFLAVSVNTYKDWVFVPKEAMRARGFTATQKVFAATAKAMTGIAFGTLAFTCTRQASLAVAGAVWLASAGVVLLFERMSKKPSKSAVRGYFVLGSIAALAAIPVLPDAGRVVGAAALSLLMVASALTNAIRHMVVEKDLTLSDVYLFGFRHATDSLGMFAGYVASFAVFTFAPPPSTAAFGFFGAAAFLVAWVSLLSLGVFESKRERIPTTGMADPWHEKVMKMAKEHGLTPRQTEIFDALSRGRNAKYIMQRLYLSEGTVKKQVFQIYKRMGVHTQQDLITLVMETDLDAAPAEEAATRS